MTQAQATRSRRQRGWCWGIFALALALRSLHLWQLRSAEFFGSRIGDAESYHRWASRIAGGDWLGEEIFYQAPLYPYFLGAIYTLLGDDYTLVLLCQALLGAGACALIASATWQLFSPAAGIVAGLLLALYAPAIFFESLIQKTVLDTFFLALAIWLMAGLVQRARPSRWLALGACLAALVLTRENALVLLAPLVLWIALGGFTTGPAEGGRAATPRSRLAFLSCLFLGLALVLGPVALRNWAVGGELHLTTSQLGPNLYMGNNPQASGTYQPLRFASGDARYERHVATELAEEALGRELTPAEVSDYWVQQVLDFIRDEPLRWLLLMGKKLALCWNAVELTDTEDQYTYAEYSWPLRLTGWLHFGVLAPLGLLGMALCWSDWRRLWVLPLLMLAYSAGVVLFYVVGRYRFPLVPLLVPFAAHAVVELARLPGAGSLWTELDRLRKPLIASLLFAAFCNLPLLSPRDMQVITYNNFGNAVAQQGRFEAAITYYRKALEIRPDEALAHHNLGVVLMNQGKREEAARHFRTVLQLQPGHEPARRHLEELARDASAAMPERDPAP